MDNLQQIVLQETTAPYVRALAQYGTGFMPENQIEVIYSELSDSDKAIWDAFVTMIKSKN
jgi:hypothetical protein